MVFYFIIVENLFERAWGLKNCNCVDGVLYFLDAIVIISYIMCVSNSNFFGIFGIKRKEGELLFPNIVFRVLFEIFDYFLS